jgi:hypothetical protein
MEHEPAEPAPAEPAEPVVVPHTELAADLLRAVIESFVLREGTDYGEQEFSLDQKVAKVMRQLERREAQIVFDPDTESVAILVVPASARRSR